MLARREQLADHFLLDFDSDVVSGLGMCGRIAKWRRHRRHSRPHGRSDDHNGINEHDDEHASCNDTPCDNKHVSHNNNALHHDNNRRDHAPTDHNNAAAHRRQLPGRRLLPRTRRRFLFCSDNTCARSTAATTTDDNTATSTG